MSPAQDVRNAALTLQAPPVGTTAQSAIENQTVRLRERFGERYDRWSLDDMSQLIDADLRFARVAMTARGAQWRTLIPHSIVREWGDEAPAAYARRIHELTRERGLTGVLFGPLLPSIVNLNANTRQAPLQVPALMTITAGNRTANLTDEQVMAHSVATESFFAQGTTVGVPIPPSVMATMRRLNPRLNSQIPRERDRLPDGRGGVGEFFAAPMAIEGGMAAARGFFSEIDRPVPRPVADRNALCTSLRQVELESYNTPDEDVPIRLALDTSIYRETTSCPAITPPSPAARVRPQSPELQNIR